MAMAKQTHLSSQVSLDPLWFCDDDDDYDDDWRPVLVSHFLPVPRCLHQSQTSLWLEREFSHNIATTVMAVPLMFLIFFIFVIFSNSFQGKLRKWTHRRKMLCARPQPTLSLVELSETWNQSVKVFKVFIKQKQNPILYLARSQRRVVDFNSALVVTCVLVSLKLFCSALF